ncbi:hypothetical protein BV25DRAFT_794638 [Artomyces pyxidatus]|uniref:Uncharacterized protein n=1 Tax=Artomyces pyxidatus TaxID=48021 RepID=A0ACB8SZ05_9AGAM|nr:hypothetical protein BV25DRAFT_794638 [Artomyces pyxidatus]
MTCCMSQAHDSNAMRQVETTAFRTHTHFLKTHSSVFRDILSVPGPLTVTMTPTGPKTFNKGKKGNEGDRYIVLKCATVLEFESLLKFFYCNMLEDFSLPVKSWIAVVSIAHRFKFHDAERRATREIYTHCPPLDPVEQIRIAEKHDVPVAFLVSALETLVARPVSLRATEVAEMSTRTVVLVGAARERYIRQSNVVFMTDAKRARILEEIVKEVWEL